MAGSAFLSRDRSARPHRPRMQRGIPESVMVVLMLIGLGVLTVIGYLLWPRWPDSPSAADPGSLPISVGGVLVNAPRDAIRVPVQRRSGTQERIDMAFAFPSLAAPGPHPRVTAENAADVKVEIDRLFLSIQAHGGAMSPDDRRRQIYARYLDGAPQTLANGLRLQAFRDTSPYRAEDLIASGNSSFVARCSRDGATPGMCLSERRIGGADLSFRFPRAWLDDWQKVAQAMETLIARLTARSS